MCESSRQDVTQEVGRLSSVGIVQTQLVTLFAPPDLLRLECGRTLGPIDVAYETYGKLNDARTNAVLLCHALTGDAHVAGYHGETDRKPGPPGEEDAATRDTARDSVSGYPCRSLPAVAAICGGLLICPQP